MGKRDGEKLLAQVWQTPEDRERLSVYADWLLQHGDATRGEYMQLALLETATAAQEKRQEALRKKHRGAWLGPARPYVYTWEESEDSPGFVSRVRCATKKLAVGFEHIRALGPRLLVSINPVTTAAERTLLASLPLGELYGLGLYETDLDWVNDRLVTMLAPKLAGLRRLELMVMSERFTLGGWRALLEALTTLEELEFSCWGSPDAYLTALLDSPLAGKLGFVTVPKPRAIALRRRVEKVFRDSVLELSR